jgi:hypothetical protein
MFAHRLGNLLEAYLDWSPRRAMGDADEPTRERRYLRQSQLLIDKTHRRHTIVSAARGGVFKHFDAARRSPVTDAGLIVELNDGRVAVSQSHDLQREIEVDDSRLTVAGPLHWARFETATPLKFAVLRVGMWCLGRWCRTLVRRRLQQRLITGRRAAPVRLTRTIEFLNDDASDSVPHIRVTDRIELTAARAWGRFSNLPVSVRRMSFGVDHQAAYVAASGVYQDSVLEPWTDLSQHVAELNARGHVTIVREL